MWKLFLRNDLNFVMGIIIIYEYAFKLEFENNTKDKLMKKKLKYFFTKRCIL